MSKLWSTRSSGRFAKPFLFFLAAASLLTGCGQPDGLVFVGDQGSSDSLMGGGSSFVYPIMNRWTSDYYKQTSVQVNYQSLGSSGGVKQFVVKTLDFGATDAPMNAEQLAEAGAEVLHIPVVMGAVAVTYNLPGVEKPLSLTGQVIGDIYLGKITKWNDPAIVTLNPDIKFPAEDIVTVRRADGSGTTFVFADFLAKTNTQWEEQIGVGNSLDWPAYSLGGKGNEGVSAQVKRTPNSLGYVELIYALEAKMPVAAIVNAAGKPVIPSVKSVTAAAADLTSVPEDLRMSITNAPGADAYPIAGMTWIVSRVKMDSAAKAGALRKFVNYVLSDSAQDRANKAHYSKLPKQLLERARAKAAQISGKQ